MSKINESEVVNNLQQTEENLTGVVKKAGQLLKDKAFSLKDEANNAMGQTLTDLKEKTSETQEVVTKYVKENPIKSIGWAALVGAVIGAIFRK